MTVPGVDDVAGGREIGDRYRLDVLEKHKHHVDFEVFLSKIEIQIRTGSKNRHYLLREQLQHGKKHYTYGESHRKPTPVPPISLSNPPSGRLFFRFPWEIILIAKIQKKSRPESRDFKNV